MIRTLRYRAGRRLRRISTPVLVAAALFLVVPPLAVGAAVYYTAAAKSGTNTFSATALYAPSAVTLSQTTDTMNVGWAAASGGGNGNGYAVSGVDNGASTTCPGTIAGYTTYVGGATGTTLADSSSSLMINGANGTHLCYLVQTGYTTAGPPWATIPPWTSQNAVASQIVTLKQIANRQTGLERTSSNSKTVTLNLPASATAGDLLVATVVNNLAGTLMTGPTGWTRAASTSQANVGEVEIWYRQNTAAGAVSVSWSTSTKQNWEGQITEWVNPSTTAALDKTGTATNSTGTTALSVATSAATTEENDLAITVFATTGGVYTPASGWTNLVNDATNNYFTDWQLARKGTVTESSTSGTVAFYAAATATFKR